MRSKSSPKDIIRKELESKKYGSVGNYTKWRELFGAILPSKASFNLKFISDKNKLTKVHAWMPHPNFIEGSGFSPVDMFEIEWIEIEIDNNSLKLLKLVKDIGLVHKQVDGFMRIYGHVRSV